MRRIRALFMISVDGYFEGKDHDLSWHNVDEEFNEFVIPQMRDTGLMLFGRRNYQLMEGYWPKAEVDPKTTPNDLEVARLMNNTPKIVISRTLKSVKEGPHWKNVSLRNKLDVDEIKQLKQQPGKDIWVGGSHLATELMKLGLVDELRIMINPVVVGEGTTIFKGISDKVRLKLVRTQAFESGNVLLVYEPEYE